MKPARRLRLRGCRAAFRLLGEVRELRHQPEAWHHRLADGLCRLFDASDGGSIVFSQSSVRATRMHFAALGGDPDGPGSRHYTQWSQEHILTEDPFLARTFHTSRPVCTTALTDLDPRRIEPTSYYRDYVRPTGLRDCLISDIRVPGSRLIHGLGINRVGRSGPFSRHDRALFRLISLEVFRLHHGALMDLGVHGEDPTLPEPPNPVDPWPSLTPRQRQVARLMLRGLSAKQIAFGLGLQTETIYSYCKAIYRRLGVSGRGEFMARFVSPAHTAERPPAEARPTS